MVNHPGPGSASIATPAASSPKPATILASRMVRVSSHTVNYRKMPYLELCNPETSPRPARAKVCDRRESATTYYTESSSWSRCLFSE
jgi:hypothetical protein